MVLGSGADMMRTWQFFFFTKVLKLFGGSRVVQIKIKKTNDIQINRPLPLFENIKLYHLKFGSNQFEPGSGYPLRYKNREPNSSKNF